MIAETEFALAYIEVAIDCQPFVVPERVGLVDDIRETLVDIFAESAECADVNAPHYASAVQEILSRRIRVDGGDETSIGELFAVNESLDDPRAIMALAPGESRSFGGGAAADYMIERVQ
ncbi:MAG: hypothetical protein WC563_15965 [Brevundimonas sp.]